MNDSLVSPVFDRAKSDTIHGDLHFQKKHYKENVCFHGFSFEYLKNLSSAILVKHI